MLILVQPDDSKRAAPILSMFVKIIKYPKYFVCVSNYM